MLEYMYSYNERCKYRERARELSSVTSCCCCLRAQAVRAHADAAEGLARHAGHRDQRRPHHAHREGLERRAQRHPHRSRARRGQRAERGRSEGTPHTCCLSSPSSSSHTRTHMRSVTHPHYHTQTHTQSLSLFLYESELLADCYLHYTKT